MMQNPEFEEKYAKIQPEMDVIRAIMNARVSQNLTQKELAEPTGINQADKNKTTFLDRCNTRMCCGFLSKLLDRLLVKLLIRKS